MAEILWKDRRRRFGLPLSFTRYSFSDEVFYRETGLLNLREESIQLYRIMDMELNRPLFQRIFNTGTIVLHSSDKTAPVISIIAVKNPKAVKEQLFDCVENAKAARRMRTAEILDDNLEDMDANS